MADAAVETSKRVLEPSERISEILFGLIMVLTFTGSLSIAESGRDDIRAMLIGALGCNLAWGMIDAVLYLMGVLAEKGRAEKLFYAARATSDPEQAKQIISEAIPPVLAGIMKPETFASLHEKLKQMPDQPPHVRLRAHDYRAAFSIFLLVFLSTFPVVIPFILMSEAHPALCASNAIAITMLFMLGWAFGKLTRGHPWIVGIVMVILGCALVAMTMALGG